MQRTALLILGLYCLWSNGSRASSVPDPGVNVPSMYHTVNYSRSDGLPQGTITDLAEGVDGEIWAASMGGLFRWSQGRWEDITDRYGLATRFLRSICIDPDKTVWIDAGGTILYLDSGAYRFETTPWHIDSVNTRRSAFYTDLRPGRYEFRVIASNNDGVWNEVGKRLTLILSPNVFQTFWFRSLCSAVAVALLGMLFVFRLRQMNLRLRRLLEQRFDARVEERTRIARDLHDSLLQGFQGLMFRLQAVRQLLPARASEAASQLDTALDTGDKTIEEGRDAVRDLRELNLIQGDLSETLAAFGEEFTGTPGSQRPSYRVLVEGEPRMLDVLIRDEVYRVAREAIRNAFRHARATHIEAELVYRSTHFCARVRDDGIGIDPHVLAQGRREGHWGLPGMRERASSFKGEFNVWSQTGAGTEVELNISAQMAYVRPTRPWWLPDRRSRGKVRSGSPTRGAGP